MNENKIGLITVSELIQKRNYFIPSYQRGYRWEPEQVTALLVDLKEFMDMPGQLNDYCLQPLVVTKREDKWEVIDGQQRLTTICLILKYLNRPNVTVTYQTRPKSQSFLENIDKEKDHSNADFFFMSQAYGVIKDWFEGYEKSGNITLKDRFFITMADKVQVIWYEVNPNAKLKEIFTRLNIGKIPLNNAELIKALFLNQQNFEGDRHRVAHRQKEIGAEWDRIEYALQNEEFWYFLTGDSKQLGSRIEFILDIVSGKNIKGKTDKLFTFKHYVQKFETLKTVDSEEFEKLWQKIKGTFLRLEEWYENRELYHLIGFLLCGQKSVEDILAGANGRKKDQFVDWLIDQIREEVEVSKPVRELTYFDGKEYQKIKKILLLFNIIITQNQDDSRSKFPFFRYKDPKQKWSLEHIHAQNSEVLTNQKDWIFWLKEHANALERMFSGEKKRLVNEIRSKATEELKEQEFKTLAAKIQKNFADNEDDNVLEPGLHTIDNLALLDGATNSALNNSIFEVKRHLILERERMGSFVPPGTRNVFLKYYSNSPGKLSYWTKTDRDDYILILNETLKPFIDVPLENTSKS
jgi:hypothetical protein